MNHTDVLRSARDLRAQGRGAEAMNVVREALRRKELSPEAVDRAGRFIARQLASHGAEPDAVRILILGQFTTSWLVTTLTAAGWADGGELLVSDGEYDSVIQELAHITTQPLRPDVVVLIPWSQRLLSRDGGRSRADRLQDEREFWHQCWLFVEQLGNRLIQVGYDWTTPGPLGHFLSGAEGDVDLIREMNQMLRQDLPAGSLFIDLEQVSGTMGRERFYDARRYFWTKQPFSEEGTCLLAEHLYAGVRALVTGPKKVLVLDLDNTLWGGVVGEAGPLGIELSESGAGEAFRAFQQHVKELARRGCLLAVSSKNNPEDAREPFEKNSAMVLKLDDFAAFEASWEPKSRTLDRIASNLRLGLDSFVFFDDSPAEREEIRQALPMVAVVEVPEDPADFVGALQRGLWFEAAGLTAADVARAEQYRVERERRAAQQAFGSLENYLRSLEMRADVRIVDDADMPRVVQLIGKTNQFNLTTRRHSVENVRQLLAIPNAFGLSLRLADRFGDYGLIGAVIAVPYSDEPTSLSLDTWLMSCRVIGRTMEQFTARTIVDYARRLGYQRIIGEFVPTKKNILVKDLYDRLGFVRKGQEPDGRVVYVLDVSARLDVTTYVT